MTDGGSESGGTESQGDFTEVLGDGERVVVAVEGLVRESGVIFDKCKIVLTEDRLVVLKHGWPWGYKIDRSIPRTECAVQNHKERFDGSQLVLVQHPQGVLCLYFGRGDTTAAVTFRAELGDPEVLRITD